MVSAWLLKKNTPIDPALILTPKQDEDARDALRGIRCPRWNTFLTRGRCPGCAHQWKWTSCLRCHEWSLHEDWYTTDSTPQSGQ